MRLIDADALKKWIDDSVSQYGNQYSTDMLNMFGLFREIIDNAPTVEYPFYQEAYQTGFEEGKNERPQNKWIPVSERLPERYKEVIVTDIEVSNTYQSRYIGNGYWECDNGTFKNRVIAWQELPEPYKKEKNDEQ